MADELPPRIESPAAANSWSEYVRERLAPKRLADEDAVRGPDWIIAQLDNASSAASTALVVVKETDQHAGDAALALARAEARARDEVAKSGEKLTVDDKAARVLEATLEERVEAERWAVALRYAKSVAKQVDERKSALQTMAKMVEVMYSTAGRGRG